MTNRELGTTLMTLTTQSVSSNLGMVISHSVKNREILMCLEYKRSPIDTLNPTDPEAAAGHLKPESSLCRRWLRGSSRAEGQGADTFLSTARVRAELLHTGTGARAATTATNYFCSPEFVKCLVC